MKALKIILAWLFALSLVLPVFGQADPTEDVTENPVVIVTAEATAPVTVEDPSTDVVVEDGGTVIINETPEEEEKTVPESDVSIVAKVGAALLAFLGLMRYGTKVLIAFLEALNKNTMAMTIGEGIAHRAPAEVRDQGTAFLDDSDRLRDLLRKTWNEWIDDTPVAARRFAEGSQPSASKPEFPPPGEPQG